MRRFTVTICAFVAMLVIAVAAQATITVYTPNAGDASYSWNSKYGGGAYATGDTSIGVGMYMGGTYGNDITVGIFEIPIAELAGKSLLTATLVVDSLGFDTGYYYGSAVIGYLDTGALSLTGDVAADGLGTLAAGRPGGFTIYNSDFGDSAGEKTFDVLSFVQADLAAGRAFTTFVLSGSRDTYGGIKTAESGSGPRIVATTVPEPGSMAMLGASVVGLVLGRRRKR